MPESQRFVPNGTFAGYVAGLIFRMPFRKKKDDFRNHRLFFRPIQVILPSFRPLIIWETFETDRCCPCRLESLTSKPTKADSTKPSEMLVGGTCTRLTRTTPKCASPRIQNVREGILGYHETPPTPRSQYLFDSKSTTSIVR